MLLEAATHAGMALETLLKSPTDRQVAVLLNYLALPQGKAAMQSLQRHAQPRPALLVQPHSQQQQQRRRVSLEQPQLKVQPQQLVQPPPPPAQQQQQVSAAVGGQEGEQQQPDGSQPAELSSIEGSSNSSGQQPTNQQQQQQQQSTGGEDGSSDVKPGMAAEAGADGKPAAAAGQDSSDPAGEQEVGPSQVSCMCSIWQVPAAWGAWWLGVEGLLCTAA
jgi:hypothetical protein